METLVIILAIASLISLEVGIILFFKYLNKREERLTREYYGRTEITEDKLELLDILVNTEFETYMKYHPDIFDVSGNSYIKESEFTGIITDITSRVCLRLTPAVQENINLTYNLKYDD